MFIGDIKIEVSWYVKQQVWVFNFIGNYKESDIQISEPSLAKAFQMLVESNELPIVESIIKETW